MIFLWIHPQISHQPQLKITKSILFLLDIKKQIFNLPEIQHVINFLIENFHELTIDDIFNEIISIT